MKVFLSISVAALLVAAVGLTAACKASPTSVSTQTTFFVTPTTSATSPGSPTVPGGTVAVPTQTVSTAPVAPQSLLSVPKQPEPVEAMIGQFILLQSSVTNMSNAAVSIANLAAEITVRGQTATVFAFPEQNTPFTLGPGEAHYFTLSWNQSNPLTSQVDPGWYQVNVNITYSHGTPPVNTTDSFLEITDIIITIVS